MVLRGKRSPRPATVIPGGGARTGAIDIGTAVDLRSRHLLLVPSTTSVDELSELVRCRVPRSDLRRTGVAELGRFSRLSGPYQLSMEAAVDAQVPMPWTSVYALTAPIERDDPPIPGIGDRDGFSDAFPAGLPWREEGRCLHLMVALARRLHGAVRVVGGGMMQPDPERAVDLTVHAPYWLDLDVVQKAVARVLPDVRPAVHGEVWLGPAPEVYSGAVVAHETRHDPLTPAELAALHHVSDQRDLADLAGSEDVLDGYALVCDLGPHGSDGAVEVVVRLGRADEPAVVGQPWADRPFVTYEVRWASTEWEARESASPSGSYLASRARVQPVAKAVARVLVEVTSGIVVDEDGLWLDRYAL